MIAPGPSLSELAADEFERRRATARRKVADNELGPDAAELHLRPWLHLAVMLGADIPECFEPGETIFPWARAGEQVQLRLSLTAEQRAQASETLAAARDAATERATGTTEPRLHDRARRLQTLAIAIGARGYRPAQLRQMEAA